MTTFWMVLVVLIVGAAVCGAICVGIIQALDGNRPLGVALVAAGTLGLAAGIAAAIEADRDDGRVCVRDHVVIIKGVPYTVCDEYAERVK